MDKGLEPVTITRTIIAGERIFRVEIEQRWDILLQLPKWEYRLVELNGVGVFYYANGNGRLQKNILWGDIMQRIDTLCGVTDIPLDREG